MPGKSAEKKAPAQGKPYTLEQCRVLVEMFLAQDRKKESRAKADFEWFNQTYCNGERVTSMIYRSAQRVFRKHEKSVKEQLKREKRERARQATEGDDSSELSSEASSEDSSDDDNDISNSNDESSDEDDQAAYDSDIPDDVAVDEANESDDGAVDASQVPSSSTPSAQMPATLTFSTIDEDAFLNTTINFSLPSVGPSATANAKFPHMVLLLPRGPTELANANFFDQCLFKLKQEIDNEQNTLVKERMWGQYANLIEKIISIRGSAYKVLAHEFEREFVRDGGYAVKQQDEQNGEGSDSSGSNDSSASEL